MSMQRRIWICLLAALLAFCASAYAESLDEWDFNAESSSVTAYRGEAESVVVPATFEGVPVQVIGEAHY